ncbi:hypothetical protein LK814_004416 [Salmonella enterica]|uniref:hypothetical protein n=1 Tax=Salmonella enterica TaxID=28901 RepID=UPI001585FB14|nr:hypothetical protein [Salmonella enterica]EEE2520673.1 hypothetical protein [Salmonella enterica subsp. enterica serovar Hato]EEF4954338.1 hypothetical protein [Salmonella enterica]EFS3538115.1 hypothetical protein [Salmonella enterica]EGL5809667.1 hypothetical protein [Salmonella enterica]EGM8340106.1 hypothetical protein [Salmonella enterica]
MKTWKLCMDEALQLHIPVESANEQLTIRHVTTVFWDVQNLTPPGYQRKHI